MAKVVYTPHSDASLSHVLSPLNIVRDLLPYRELIAAYTKREYQAMHRSTMLGAAWSMLNPLILLALFTFVFGYVFHGRFSTDPNETPADFALALFVGLSLYICVGNALGQAPNLMLANSSYVKTLAFPLEILPVSLVIVLVINLLISLGLCLAAFLITKGFVHWTSIFVLFHVAAMALIALGITWFLSAVGVFVRDTSPIVSPISMVLMFVSGVFFSLDALPPKMKFMFQLNPLAIIIYQARQAMLHGQVPNILVLACILALSVGCAIFGYYFFSRTKIAFADVM